MKFQGGFASSQVELEMIKDKTSTKLTEFYPEDINSLQTFEILKDEFEASDCYRLKFEKTTDFFGRIIIYNLQMYGLFD